MKSKGAMAMENKLEKIGQNNFMDNFVKTDDILKDMCGIIESSQKAAYRAVNTTLIPVSYTHLDVYKRQMLNCHRTSLMLV